MIPRTIEISTEEAAGTLVIPSFTYYLDFANGRIIGTIDNADSIVQAIDKLFQTMRYSSVIYDWLYGNEFFSLIGKSYGYVIVEIPRIVEECLMQDDRVIAVHDFQFEKVSIDSVHTIFLVDTIYGTVSYSMEVKI